MPLLRNPRSCCCLHRCCIYPLLFRCARRRRIPHRTFRCRHRRRIGPTFPSPRERRGSLDIRSFLGIFRTYLCGLVHWALLDNLHRLCFDVREWYSSHNRPRRLCLHTHPNSLSWRCHQERLCSPWAAARRMCRCCLSVFLWWWWWWSKEGLFSFCGGDGSRRCWLSEHGPASQNNSTAEVTTILEKRERSSSFFGGCPLSSRSLCTCVCFVC